MKTLHRYLLREVLATLVLTVGVFTAVLLMGNAMKEVLALVVRGQASLAGVGKAFVLLIPFVISFSLPMGLLTAMLLVFGRFSADQELTAARAGGLSLVSLVAPVLLLAVGFSGLNAWINLSIAPRCRTAYKELVYDMALSNPAKLLSANTFVTEVPGYVIYIGELEQGADERHWHMKRILLNRIEDGELIQRTRAARGEVSYDSKNKQYLFRLIDAQVNVRADKLGIVFGGNDEGGESEPQSTNNSAATHSTNSTSETETKAEPNPFPDSPDWMPMAGGEIILPITLAEISKQSFKPKLSYLTFNQLRREMDRHGEIINIDSNGSVALVHYATIDSPAPDTLYQVTRHGNRVGRARITPEKTPAHLVAEITEGTLHPGDRLELERSPLKVQLHRQISFSFAAIGFTLVSIPLGIRAHRRETTAGIAMALVLILIYYSFVILGQALADKPQYYPHLIVWIPVFLFQAAGMWMLARANCGSQ
ncbi:MAG: LptF/LptG family permease [Verrucomicrobia subdivision 3 bacterium]|nr:LptF/LptG family permease [Limisphaerales bacterium]